MIIELLTSRCTPRSSRDNLYSLVWLHCTRSSSPDKPSHGQASCYMIVNPLTKQDTPYDLFFAGGAVSPSVLTDMVTRWTCNVVKAGKGNVIQIRVFRRRWQRQPGEVAFAGGLEGQSRDHFGTRPMRTYGQCMTTAFFLGRLVCMPDYESTPSHRP